MPRPPMLDRRRRPSLRVAAASLTVILLALAGCGSAPVAYQGLASAGHLRPADDADTPFLFRSPTADLAGYSKILIDPVSVYDGPDGQFGSVSREDRAAIAAYMREKFTETLGRRYQVVTEPGPGALRLHLTLTGIEVNVPVISTVSHLVPAGLVINTALQVADRNGTFFGSVSYAAEVSDAATGELLYAYVTRQTPDALDVTASFGSLAAARTGVRIGARQLREQLSQFVAVAGGPTPGSTAGTR
jgi:hypothetical protein